MEENLEGNMLIFKKAIKVCFKEVNANFMNIDKKDEIKAMGNCHDNFLKAFKIISPFAINSFKKQNE